MCEKLTKCLGSHLDNGIHDADTEEVGKVVDMIKDLSDAKEKIVKAMYHTEILKAMEESEYGKDYDEEGQLRGYRGRSARTGRYVHRPYTESMRDMDMPDKMYYTDNMRGYEYDKLYTRNDDEYRKGYSEGHEDGMRRGMNQSNNNSGRMYQAKRYYDKAKENNDKEQRTKHLNDMMASIKEEITPMLPEMDVNEKMIVKNGLQSVQNMI